MKILIGGGSGFIGTVLTKMLVRRGHRVHWVTRDKAGLVLARLSTMLDANFDDVFAVEWNTIMDKGLPGTYDAVVNLAGQNLMNIMERWNDDFRDSLEASRTHTTEILVTAIQKAKIKPTVYIGGSAIGYYKADPEMEYTENSPGGNFDFMSRLCTSWENASLPLEGTETRRATVRIGLALGRSGGLILQTYQPFFFGLGGPLGSGNQWFPWIHVQDVAGIIMMALEDDAVTGVLNAVAPQHITNEQFTKAYARAMNRPAFFRVPSFALRLAYGKERADAILEGQKVVPKRTMDYGYIFKYPEIESAAKAFCRLAPID